MQRHMTPNFMTRSVFTLMVATTVDCGGPQSTDEPVPSRSVETQEEPLVGGTGTFVRPEIGALQGPGCTATLVDPNYIITAAHCFGYTSGPRSDIFQMKTTSGSDFPPVTVDRSYVGGLELGGQDIAFGHLSYAIPSTTAVPAIIGSAPASNEQVSAFGYGCTSRPSTGGGFKQFVDYSYGVSYIICPGDSGGPRVHGFHTANGSIWGINSGFKNSGGSDLIGDAAQYGPAILRAVRTFGGTTVTNSAVTDFPSWAASAGVKTVSGDFNADGFGDIALTGGSGWAGIPVAFGDGAGGFTVTNAAVANFPGWATAARNAVSGDFDGDGDTDIALFGGSGWSTVPIAFSSRDGTFTVTNLSTPNIPAWAQTTGAYPVAGDFDADGDTDVALLGGSGWFTIPVGFSNRNGTFAQSNTSVANFPGWSQTSGVRGVAGDFDGDGDADLALTGGSGWYTIPVAFSNRTGGFTVTNTSVSQFPYWATLARGGIIAGDFDGDGDADIAAVGGSGWWTTAFALSDRAGGFLPANFPMADFPGWGSSARGVLPVRVDSGATTDIVLTGGSGWSTIPVATLRP